MSNNQNNPQKWVQYDSEECPKCKTRTAHVLTRSTEDNLIYDGEEARCFTCQHTGVVSVEDSECADVVWDDYNPQEVPQVKSVDLISKAHDQAKLIYTNWFAETHKDFGLYDQYINGAKYMGTLCESRIVELEADLNSANKRIDHYRTEVSKIRCFTFDSNNNIGQNGQNIFEAIQQTIAELENQNKYLELKFQIACEVMDERMHEWTRRMNQAEQALNSNKEQP